MAGNIAGISTVGALTGYAVETVAGTKPAKFKQLHRINASDEIANGAWKGLYYLNNELYVSFNAALGGTLTLGGQNNGNGLLILLDDEGAEIGRMSSGGTSFRNSDNNIVIRINKSGMFFYDSTGQKRKVLTDSSGITIYTNYTDTNNWKAIKIGKYGIYAAEKSGGVEDLWMEGDTSHQWDGYILRFLNGAVRLNANAVYTDGCSMGKNLTTSGTLTWYDYEQQSLDNPKVGDIVIFKHNGTFTHTGLVTAVVGDRFYTIEGNTSGASGIIANGGGVCAKSYLNSQMPGTKFCTPDWKIVNRTSTNTSTGGKYMFEPKTVVAGSTGLSVLLLQEILVARKFKGKDGKELELDRSAGTNTIYALNAYKKSRGMKQDGICDAAVWKDLIAL